MLALSFISAFHHSVFDSHSWQVVQALQVLMSHAECAASAALHHVRVSGWLNHRISQCVLFCVIWQIITLWRKLWNVRARKVSGWLVTPRWPCFTELALSTHLLKVDLDTRSKLKKNHKQHNSVSFTSTCVYLPSDQIQGRIYCFSFKCQEKNTDVIVCKTSYYRQSFLWLLFYCRIQMLNFSWTFSREPIVFQKTTDGTISDLPWPWRSAWMSVDFIDASFTICTFLLINLVLYFLLQACPIGCMLNIICYYSQRNMKELEDGLSRFKRLCI